MFSPDKYPVVVNVAIAILLTLGCGAILDFVIDRTEWRRREELRRELREARRKIQEERRGH